ncbi:unnamed protein product, partial [Staurois parvus]
AQAGAGVSKVSIIGISGRNSAPSLVSGVNNATPLVLGGVIAPLHWYQWKESVSHHWCQWEG